MEQKIKHIIKHLGDIGEKLGGLLTAKSVSSIEVDIILGEMRTLYEEVKNLNTSAPDPSGKETAAEPPFEKAVEDEELRGTEITDEEAGPEGVETEKADTAGPVSHEKVSGKTDKIRKTVPSKKSPEPAILADKYKGDKKFINESLAGKKEDISSKIQSKPIPSINSALGINDRFKLINDLFNGDKDSFQNTIGILDGASNFNEAFNYISSSFEWDMEEDSVQFLLELVRRKFIISENE